MGISCLKFRISILTSYCTHCREVKIVWQCRTDICSVNSSLRCLESQSDILEPSSSTLADSLALCSLALLVEENVRLLLESTFRLNGQLGRHDCDEWCDRDGLSWLRLCDLSSDVKIRDLKFCSFVAEANCGSLGLGTHLVWELTALGLFTFAGLRSTYYSGLVARAASSCGQLVVQNFISATCDK